MKIRRLTLLVLIIALFTVSAAWCDVIDDLMANDRQLAGFSAATGSAAADLTALQLRESELFAALLQSDEDIKKFVSQAEATDSEILNRFYDRVRFEVSHEKRSELSFLIEDLNDGAGATDARNKKIVFIYGSEINLLDGEWRSSPDGRRFWVSNECPDIVLSPAEYKRHFKNAATVEE